MISTATAPITVEQMASLQSAEWDAFVNRCPAASVFHRLEWSRAVHASYGHQPMHLAAWQNGSIVGVLPLFLVESAIAGRIIVSVPYATYGGIATTDHDVAKMLLSSATELSAQTRATYLELRHRDNIGLELPTIDRYDTFRKALPQRPQDVLPSLPAKTRTAVRRGFAALGEKSAYFGPQWLDAVYDLYASTLRRLGSPNYKRQLFCELQKQYGDNCICLVIKDNDRPIAGVMSFVDRDEIVPYFSGSTEDGMSKRANNIMYLRLMERAVEMGLRVFDFNRTRRDNSGPYDFKRHHGFSPTPLHYQVLVRKGGQLPNLSPSNGKFALAGRAWRRLPLWVTRPLGEAVSKWIP